jgi:hypothetical protein
MVLKEAVVSRVTVTISPIKAAQGPTMAKNDDRSIRHPLHSKAMEAESPRAKARREAREQDVRDQERRDQEPASDVSRQAPSQP